MIRRFLFLVSAMGLALGTSPFFAPQTALADTGTCPIFASSTTGNTFTAGFDGRTWFEPGLNGSLQAISYYFSGKVKGCSSPDFPTIKEGIITAAGKGNVSCTAGTTTGTATVTWNAKVATPHSGTTNLSTIKFTTTTTSPGNIHVHGTITKGVFFDGAGLGDFIDTDLFFTANPTACAGGGNDWADFTNTTAVSLHE